MNDEAKLLNDRGVAYLQNKDYISAYKYFAEAARLGSIEGIYNMGYCYVNGFGVQKNYVKAYQYLRRFTGTNSYLAKNAEYLCGEIFNFGGYGIEKNETKALEYYCMAADKGHAWAFLKIGAILQLRKDYSQAKKYIKTAMNLAPNDNELIRRGKTLLKVNLMERICGN